MVLEVIPAKTRRNISNLLFLAAIIMAIPPLPFEFFTDIFLNLPLATYISEQFGFSLINSLLSTYLLVPVILIYLGSIIRPTDTTKTFNSQLLKLKNFFIRYVNLIKRNPVYLLGVFVVIAVLFKLFDFYTTQISVLVLQT